MDRQDLSPFSFRNEKNRSEDNARGDNLILCGLKRSGKTQLARLIANKLDYPMIDTDHFIEHIYREKHHSKKRCRAIALQYGDPYFRDLELEAANFLKEHKKTVIALGGGTLIRPQTAQLLKKLGTVIYCSLDKQETLRRWLEIHPLPTFIRGLSEKEIDEVIEKRIDACKQWADITFEIPKENCDILADKIIDWLKTDG